MLRCILVLSATHHCLPPRRRTIKLLGKHGFASPEEKVDWLRNWERVWKV